MDQILPFATCIDRACTTLDCGVRVSGYDSSTDLSVKFVAKISHRNRVGPETLEITRNGPLVNSVRNELCYVGNFAQGGDGLDMTTKGKWFVRANLTWYACLQIRVLPAKHNGVGSRTMY